jgi:LuxR family maltose regulon positive regulatory protein
MRQLAEETETLNTTDEIHWQLVPLALAFWYTESLQREGALLTPRLLEAKLHAVASGDQTAILRVMRLLALTYMRAGRLRLLEQETCEGLAFIEAAGELSAMTGYFSSYLIEAYYASNRLAEAAQAAREVLRIAQLWHHADLLYVANDAIAWVALASRDIVTAKVALAELEELARQERFAIHAGVMSATRTRYWLATGNLAAARNWAAQQVFSPETWHANRQFELLQVIRVLLADRQHAQALELLQAFSAHFDRPGDIYSTILFLALHGVALQATGQNEHAQAVVMRLLDLTAPEDNIRVFLDEGAPMRNVLQELYDAEPNNWDKLAPTSRAFVAKLLYAFDAEAQRDIPPTQHTALHHANALAEPLTRREQDVLRLLIAGASNNEIAERLVISLATVKKHVGNILGKLGVASRAQAVARAHDLPHLF